MEPTARLPWNRGPADAGTATVGQRQVQYRLRHSSRARSVRLKITPDGVVHVTVPNGHHLSAIQEVLQPKAGWITKHLRQLDELNRAHGGPLATGSVLPYLGRDRRLEVLEAPMTEPLISLLDDTLYVGAPSTEPEALADTLGAWYRDRASDLFSERVQQWARTMRVKPQRLTIRDQRTRWGSCSTSGNLNFNWRLVMAPLGVLDYVVIHELMHLREMNHSERFWNGVARYCPAYSDHRNWLRQNGQWLARVLAP